MTGLSDLYGRATTLETLRTQPEILVLCNATAEPHTEVYVRPMSCACSSCISFDWENCLKAGYVAPFETKTLQRI